jgi:DNA-binding transcriptional ArsR family regulator
MLAIDKARSHPLRRRILLAMQELGEPLSPAEFARRAEAPVSDAAYHFRVLESSGLIDLDHTAQNRGALQHFYVSSPKFTTEMHDGVALDRIAEILDEATALVAGRDGLDPEQIAQIVQATGRPLQGEAG